MEVIDKILNVFKIHGIRAGQVLDKKLLMSEIGKFSADEKKQVRDVWHLLIGNGYLSEVNPSGPTLTVIGERKIYGHN